MAVKGLVWVHPLLLELPEPLPPVYLLFKQLIFPLEVSNPVLPLLAHFKLLTELSLLLLEYLLLLDLLGLGSALFELLLELFISLELAQSSVSSAPQSALTHERGCSRRARCVRLGECRLLCV